MTTLGNDTGHGSDTFDRTGGKGVIVNGKIYEEHSFNSRVTLALSAHLKRCGIGEKRIQQPNKPEVSLTRRTDFYNAENVDAVISNHANANRNKSIKGICVFAWHNHPESQRLQKLLIEEYEKMGFDTHGNGDHESELGSWTDLHIVRETKMTACLIENGFMTNPDDFKKIFLDPGYAERCAEAQARALCRFFNKKYIEVVANPQQKEEEEMIKMAVVVYSDADISVGYDLANEKKCGLYNRKSLANEKLKINELMVVGGPTEGLEKKTNRVIDLSGANRWDTRKKVISYLGK
ncbi:N-acetylmuramoyl-L-alanine amidase [Rossellomorea vietnamensis]|uniref:N-acetylmuramoyl-L-alanine amidase n=1 Tax=Rossellomorea vietnamensis TaxID=218284 RepID=A0ACD4C772_9BACI|nr:N-acetylmuramoyl-L-alanine amidase [Rossellomorea vietnamensis]UXH44465.1 N-acetylmuramoyl-L-alanine amidase [Rossellomorea vietnamensis]